MQGGGLATSQWEDDKEMVSLFDHEEPGHTRASPPVRATGESGPSRPQAPAEPPLPWLPSCGHLSPCLCGPVGGLGVRAGLHALPWVLGLRAPSPQRQWPCHLQLPTKPGAAAPQRCRDHTGLPPPLDLLDHPAPSQPRAPTPPPAAPGAAPLPHTPDAHAHVHWTIQLDANGAKLPA